MSRLLTVLAATTVLVGLVARMGGRRRRRRRREAGRTRHRRPVLPARRQRRLRRRALRPRPRATTRRPTGSTASPTIRRRRHPAPVPLQPRPDGLTSLGRPSTAAPRDVDPRRRRARRHARRDGLPRGLRVHRRGRPTAACPVTVARSRSAPPGSCTPTTARSSPGSPSRRPTWFPVNDHPTRQGDLRRSTSPCRTGSRPSPTASCAERRTADGWTTWRWDAREPMASYLATVGDRRVRRHAPGGPTPVYRSRRGRLRHHRRPAAADDRLVAGPRSRRDRRLPEPGGSGRTRSTPTAAIVDDARRLCFALETQTRPVYPAVLLRRAGQSDDLVVAHELAHQWFGDSVALAPLAGHLAQRGLRHLRRVAVGRGTRARRPSQELFDDATTTIAGRRPFWTITIGDPGADRTSSTTPSTTAGR